MDARTHTIPGSPSVLPVVGNAAIPTTFKGNPSRLGRYCFRHLMMNFHQSIHPSADYHPLFLIVRKRGSFSPGLTRPKKWHSEGGVISHLSVFSRSRQGLDGHDLVYPGHSLSSSRGFADLRHATLSSTNNSVSSSSSSSCLELAIHG